MSYPVTPATMQDLINSCRPLNAALASIRAHMGGYAKHIENNEHVLLTGAFAFDLAAFGMGVYNLTTGQREDPYDFEFFNTPGPSRIKPTSNAVIYMTRPRQFNLPLHLETRHQPSIADHKFYVFVHDPPKFGRSGTLIAIRSLASRAVADSVEYMTISSEIRKRDCLNSSPNVITNLLNTHKSDHIYTQFNNTGGVSMFGSIDTNSDLQSIDGTMVNSGTQNTSMSYLSADVVEQSLKVGNQVQMNATVGTKIVNQNMMQGENHMFVPTVSSMDFPQERLARAASNIASIMGLTPGAIAIATPERVGQSTAVFVDALQRTTSAMNIIAMSINTILKDLKYAVTIFKRRSTEEISLILKTCRYEDAKILWAQHLGIDSMLIDDKKLKFHISELLEDGQFNTKAITELADRKVDRAKDLSNRKDV